MTLSFFLHEIQINGITATNVMPTATVGINVHNKILRFFLALASLSSGRISISLLLSLLYFT
jgi:hypothetical protein